MRLEIEGEISGVSSSLEFNDSSFTKIGDSFKRDFINKLIELCKFNPPIIVKVDGKIDFVLEWKGIKPNPAIPRIDENVPRGYGGYLVDNK